MRWAMRITAATLTAAGAGFVVWEVVDYRGAEALSLSAFWLAVDLVCLGATWIATRCNNE